MAILLMCLWALGIFAADGNSPAADASTPPAAKSAQPNANSNEQITALKQQMVLQQKQIEQMQKVLEEQKRLLEQLTKPAPASGQAAQPAKPVASTQPAAQPAQPAVATQQTAQPHASSLGEVASTTPIIPQSQKKAENATVLPAAGTTTIAANSNAAGDQETSPLQLHIGDATLTPVGFMDFTSVWRNKAAGGNIGYSFGSIPYGTSYQTNLSELRFSIQNSRIGFRTDADVKGFHVIGYMEADFLGTPASTNIAVTNNAQLLRNRLYWVDLRRGGWEILGGQTWSLATPGRKGISPIPSDVFYTQNMDVNYQAGLFWGRIPELRFVYHLAENKAAFAFAIDSPDQYAGGSSGGGSITLPTLLSTYSSELDFGSSSGGIATPNFTPDFIAKLAFDPIKQVHFEIGGLERNFKVWDPGTAANATTGYPAIPSGTFSSEGAAGFLNLNMELFKGFRFLTNNFWSDGGGRYIFGQAPDVVVNANGTITPLHSASTVTGFEYTHKNTLIFAYYGGIMIGRDAVIDSNGKLVGYGYAGSSTGNNRTIQEATFGFNQTVWKHPKYGAINIIGQYSYVTRDPWYITAATPANPPNANNNALYFDLRYTLPGSAPTLGRPAP
ncbi:MAG: hypothetical protein WAO35_02725 [Terriglobia bacterium]